MGVATDTLLCGPNSASTAKSSSLCVCAQKHYHLNWPPDKGLIFGV